MMTEYRLLNIDDGSFERAVSFAWSRCTDVSQRSYLMFADRQEAEDEFSKVMADPDSQLVGCYDGSQLVGVMSLAVEPQEHYLQTTGFYYDRRHPQVIDLFIGQLEHGYPGCTAYVGLPYENRAVAGRLAAHGFGLVNDCSDMRRAMAGWDGGAGGGRGVRDVGPSDWPRYAAYHDRVFPGIYYDSVHLAAEADRFVVLALYDGTAIGGALFMKTGCSPCAEVFGLHAPDQPGARALLHAALERLPPQDAVVFMVDQDDAVSMAAALAEGLRCTSRYICYAKDII